MLKEDKDIQQLIADMEVGAGGANVLGLSTQNMMMGSINGFDQRSFSASDSSLADQYSPPFSSVSQYGNQYSPSTGSIDSGIPSDIVDSPILSPDQLSVDYPSPLSESERNLDQMLLNGTTVDNNQISPQMLLKLIQQQVQQALLQQQQQQQQQQQKQQQQSQLDLQQNLQQQRINLLTQQHNSQLIQQSLNASKNDSQLRKMLTQTKNNITQTKNTIIHTLQDKKEKIQRVFPKGNTKPGKRKIVVSQEDVKEEKVQVMCTPDDNIMISADKDVPVTAENLEAFLMQQVKPGTPTTTNYIQVSESLFCLFHFTKYLKFKPNNEGIFSSLQTSTSPLPWHLFHVFRELSEELEEIKISPKQA